MVYDTLKTPPAVNSPLELICMYVFHTRQRTQYLQTLLLMPPSATEETSKHRTKLAQTYAAELFPYEKGTQEREAQNVVKIMEEIAARGPQVVTPIKPS